MRRVRPEGANLKFPAENFAGDAYHVTWSHLSAISTGFSPPVTARKAWKGSLLSPGHGHGIIALGPEDTAAAPEPAILAYEAEIRPEVMRRLGPRSALINPIVGTVFPNFSLLRAAAHTFRIWHPRGLDKVEIWSWSYVDRTSDSLLKMDIRAAHEGRRLKVACL